MTTTKQVASTRTTEEPVATAVDSVATTSENMNTAKTAEGLVQQMIKDAGISSTTTKGGWCLRRGLVHVLTADGGRLFRLVESQGPPSFYHSLKSCRHEPTDNIKAPENCFSSLCRIISGQQLAGKAAQSIWKRLLETSKNDLTPATIVSLAGTDGTSLETALQKPSGLSGAKARSILDLARRFEATELSEDFLNNPKATEAEIREALLQVKGLGPWSCDMFIMFHLEKSDVFPFGDLGVRKGVAKVFQVKGKGKQGSLCQKKDLERACEMVKPYRPYQSLLTYYMWRAADSKDVYAGVNNSNDDKKSAAAGAAKVETITTTTTPAGTPNSRKRKSRVVTPS